MKNLILLLSSTLFTLFLTDSFAQTLTMGVGANPANACSGTFLDPGGSGNYGNNQNITYTICPSTPGSFVQVDFTTFDLEDGYDFLTIYNGSSTASPTLGTYSGTVVPGLVQGSNGSGCLTFVFSSDASFTESGWVASISCTQPCQTVIPNFTTNPGFSSATNIDVCQGQNISFNATGGYPQNGTSYTQSDATSTFQWFFGDGSSANTQNANHSYSAPGYYQVDLEVTDINGCSSTIDIDVIVRVSADPVFTGSFVTDPVICIGETNTLTGVVTPTEIGLDCTPPVAGLTFLPDGSGVSYQTSITVDCFSPGQTLTNANQLDDVCIEMEHSYLGDLDLVIQCPNGQQTILHNYGSGGGGTYLGNPIDNTTGGPGSGFVYCFDMGATSLLVNGPTVTSGSPAGNAIAAGSYLPEQSFANLVGCPLNGDWTIIITDNLAADDGYIFGWGMNFDPAITPPSSTYTPPIVSESWQADPTIVSTAGNTITVQPTTAGTSCYTYQAVDEFNCTYDTTICFTVLPSSDPSCPNCYFDFISTNTGFCETGSVFTVDGQFSYQSNPGSGSVVVTITNGSGSWTQTFTPPFTDGQLYNYSISGITADGSPATVTIAFTSDPTCTISQNITSPAGCNCDAEIGTFTVTSDGNVAGNNITLCFGDLLDIETNDDWVAPAEATNPPGPVYDPGVSWLIYSCPPSVALTPNTTTTIPDDPCLLGVVSDYDLAEINDQFWINAYPPGTFTDNIVYFVPITMYSIQDGTYSYVNTTMPCYELGAPYAVQYLPEITSTPTEDCTAGTVSVVVSGGLPEIDGSNFTGQNLSPATASFTTGTTGNGGTIVVGGLQDGDNYSFDIVDGNGCPVTITGTFQGLEDPSFSYPQNAYCQNAANPTATITGTPGGTFSSAPGGLVINAGTGQVNLGASTAGTYTITYTTPDAVCFDQSTFVLTVNPLPVVDGNDATICAGQSVTLNGTGADTYVWSGGVTNGVAFTPGATQTYTVTGTVTATGCSSTGNATVTVNPLDNASFTTTNYCAGSASPAATITGTAGGTFTYNPNPADGSTVNPTTGSITGGVGGTTYTLEYTTSGACPASSTQPVTVYALPVVDVPDYSVCTGGTITLTATGANTYSWSPGTFLSATTGASVDYTAGSNQVYTVTGTDANGCVDTDITSVTVLANAPINAGADQTICMGESANLLASGGVTYNWQAPIGAAGAAQTVTPGSTTTYTVDGVDAQGCTGTDQVTVTVNPLPTATVAGTVTVCEGAANQTITFTGANATAPYTITYTLNGGANQTIVTTGSTATISVSAATAGTFTYALVSVEDANGCMQNQVGSATVTVNALPNVNAGVDQTVCDGVQVTLSGSGANTYVWNNGVTNNTAFTPAVGTVTYTVTGTDGNGCVNTDQVDVTVNALPNVNAGVDQTVCDGVQVTLSGSGANTYVWDNGITNNTAFTPSLGTVVYTVTGTDANGCVNTDQVSVTVNPNPTPVINGATEYCTGTFSTLSTTQAYTTYAWTTGDATPTTDVTVADNPISVTVTNGFGCSGTSATFTVSENNVITYNASITICQGESAVIHGNTETVAGVYSQTYTLPTGCDSTSNITLNVNPLPNVNAGVDQAVCTGVATTLSASGAVNYVWDNGVTNGVAFTQGIGTITYTVTGTDANGCVNTDQVDVTVNALPNVNAGVDQTVCDGAQVTLSGSGANTYVWNNGVNDNTAFTPAVGTVTYTVTGTDGNGCVNTDQVDVTVNALPNVNAGVDQTVCDGVQVTLSGSGANTYVWSGGVTNGVAFTQAVGTVTYTVTGTDGNGCVNTDQVDVTVNALPNVNAGIDQTVCLNDQVTLSGSGASSYVWDNGVTNNTAFNPPLGTTTYTVTGTDANGCVNTDQVTVTVNPLPTATISGTSSVCVGGADQTITFTGANGTAPYTFSYTLNGGAVQTITSTGNTATLTVPAAAVGTFSFSLVSVQDASSTACSQTQAGTATITVNALPNVFAGNDVTICEGDQVVLTGSGAVNYAWDNGVNNGIGFTPTATNTYTVTGTDANGCVNTDQVIVTVSPLPVVSFVADVTSGCAPLTVTFTNTTPGTLSNCTWSFGNGTSATGCGSVTTTFTQSGLFDVSLSTTSSDGCTSSVTYTDYIYVEAVPVASFTPSNSVVSILNTDIHFNNTSSNATDYVWDFGDESPSSTVENPSHVFPNDEPGNYVVELIATSPLGCADTATRVIVIQDELIFYVPNTFTPDGDDFNEYFQAVFTSGYDPYDFNMLIFNRWGEIIWESHDASVGWDGTYGEGRSQLVQDGTYTWKIDFKTTMTDERIEVVGHVNVVR